MRNFNSSEIYSIGSASDRTATWERPAEQTAEPHTTDRPHTTGRAVRRWPSDCRDIHLVAVGAAGAWVTASASAPSAVWTTAAQR